MKPRLTDKVLRGIVSATSLAKASPEDFIGQQYGAWTDEDKRVWSDVETADAWARAVQDVRAVARGRKPKS